MTPNVPIPSFINFDYFLIRCLIDLYSATFLHHVCPYRVVWFVFWIALINDRCPTRVDNPILSLLEELLLDLHHCRGWEVVFPNNLTNHTLSSSSRWRTSMFPPDMVLAFIKYVSLAAFCQHREKWMLWRFCVYDEMSDDCWLFFLLHSV